jgi:outer membrane protein
MRNLFLLIFTIFFSSQGLIFSQQKKWSLEDCIKYAVEHNIQIKQQIIQTDVQKNSLDLAKFQLLPTINGQASHSYSSGRALDQSTYTFVNQTLQSDYFYIGGQMPLFNGLQNYNNIQKNKYLVLASQQDLQSISDNVALNVALAYLQLLLNKELVAANENQLNITIQQIEKTQKLVDAGSVARGNLLQIQAQAAQEELSLITQKNLLESSILTLTQYLELQTPAGFEIVAPEITVDPDFIITGNIEEIFGIANKNRPEVKSSELKLTASEYNLKMAKGGRSPQLSLNYSYNARYSNPSNLPGDQSFVGQLKTSKSPGAGLTLNIPILNGWQVNKNISNSKLDVESSEYNVEGAKKQLYKSIQQAYTDAVAAHKKYNVSIKAVASTEESFRYTEQKFNVGMVTPVDYNAAKTQLLNAQSDMSQAKYEYLFKTKVLDFYKGIPLSLNQ